MFSGMHVNVVTMLFEWLCYTTSYLLFVYGYCQVFVKTPIEVCLSCVNVSFYVIPSTQINKI